MASMRRLIAGSIAAAPFPSMPGSGFPRQIRRRTTMTMTTNTLRRAPTHSIFVVQGEGSAACWTRIGAAWPNQDGKGFSMKLDAAPVFGRVVMRENRLREDGNAALI